MDLKIAGRQRCEVGLQLFPADGLRQQTADFVTEQLALLFFGAKEQRAARELLKGFAEMQQQQGIFEPVPQLVAGAEGVGKGV